MSIFSRFLDHNRNFMGNALKNIAPAAFLIPGVGPLAAAGIAGAGSALGRGIQKGANIGDILKQGATGAAMAYGGGELTGGQGHSLAALRDLFSGGGGAGGASHLADSGGQQFGQPMSKFMPGSQGSGFGLGHAANAIGEFVQKNPTAVGMGLQGVGNLAQAGSENAYRSAQARNLDLQNQGNEYDLQSRKRRDLAMDPLRQALMAQFAGMGSANIAANPYTGR